MNHWFQIWYMRLHLAKMIISWLIVFTSISVTASETIFGIEAGNSLNEKLEFYTFETSNSNQNIDALVNYLNSRYNDPEGVNIVLKQAIETPVSLFFSISITLENDEIITWNSPNIDFV